VCRWKWRRRRASQFVEHRPWVHGRTWGNRSALLKQQAVLCRNAFAYEGSRVIAIPQAGGSPSRVVGSLVRALPQAPMHQVAMLSWINRLTP